MASRSVPGRARGRHFLALGALTAVGVAAGSGLAYAYWSSTGSGTAAATARTAVNSVISSATAPADLYPGATSSVTVTITNPNPYPVLVTGIGAGSSAVVATSCTAGTVTSAARTDSLGIVRNDTSARSIAASSSGTYSLTTSMSSTAVDACQGQSFSLTITATVQSA